MQQQKIGPQFKKSNNGERFTLMGITNISGKLLMCCIIFKGVKYWSETETGIDFTINNRCSSDNQQEFIENNLEYRTATFDPLTGKDDIFLEVQLVYLKRQ